MDRDAEHLRLLSLFYYIRGALSAFFSCFFILYIVMGLIMAMIPTPARGNNAPSAAIGYVFAAVGCAIVLLGWSLAAVTLYAGHCISQRKHRMFCMVVAGISCLFIPYGTILGVFTLLVLQRPSVRDIFDHPGIVP